MVLPVPPSVDTLLSDSLEMLNYFNTSLDSLADLGLEGAIARGQLVHVAALGQLAPQNQLKNKYL
ncbi:hypothetical protein NG799_16985 [Laspinema sp. D1]|uniref:Uncharacterized protein n=1 Tax=Laspinema palackyanum D2a TaxID=2953684 RepID=A0ABT2MTD2_9CYAN|nr:hypothetical protein [Laspinema sp. D2a]